MSEVALLQAFVAGYAVSRAVDYAFDRNWKATITTLLVATVMGAFLVAGHRP